jgi:protocatechuate 4,5-dioxygenase, beta chain
MASIVGGFIVPHDPLIFINPQKADGTEVFAAFCDVRRRIAALEANCAIVIGADHYILFGPNCLPQFVIGIGEAHGPIDALPGVANRPIPTHPELATQIARHGHAAGYDWAVSKSMAVDHAVGVPVRCCLPDDDSVAVVPVYLASGVEPLVSKRRAFDLGCSIASAVADFPSDDRVVVIGSGGISHWVGTAEMGRINSDFDHMVLGALELGDHDALIALDDAKIFEQAGNGAFEIRQFLCAMGAVGSGAGETIAYLPWKGGATGLGFAELKVAT